MDKTCGNEEREWCPTQAGHFIGYDAEFFNGVEWLSVPTEPVTAGGVQYPQRNGGILTTITLYGRAQAESLAWQFAASAESKGATVDIRVQKYEIEYDIKASKILGQ